MFDVYTTVVFPIVGGIIVGVIVILIELGFRVLYEWNQRKRGAKDISRFFGKWEAAINTSADLPASPEGVVYPKGQIQFAQHKGYISLVPFTVSRWSKYLSDQQIKEIDLFIFGGEFEISILPPDSIFGQETYDRFFHRAREIKWLKF